jgi:hypothetical protein
LASSVQAVKAVDQTQRQVPEQTYGSPGGGAVLVVVVVVVVVVPLDGEQSSPIRTIAQRSQVPGSRQRIRAEPQTTARRTSTAPSSTSAYW